jgi:hypothetical protein
MARNLYLCLISCLLLTSCGGATIRSSSSANKKGLLDLFASEKRDISEPSVRSLDEPKEQDDGLNIKEECEADPERVSRILAEADPENYPKIRYKKGTRWEQDKSTDCSWFVYDVFERAGLPFRYRPTASLKGAPEFDLLPWKDRQAGDLVLFRGHVGILDTDGKVISATRTRRRHERAITKQPPEFFRKLAGDRPILRYRCSPENSSPERNTATFSEKKTRETTEPKHRQ